MFIEIRTTLNTVLPAHREVLKLLHLVGALEEQELRAQFAEAHARPQDRQQVTQEQAANAVQLELFQNAEDTQSYFNEKEALVNGNEG